MSDGVILPLGDICRNASRRFSPPEDGKVWFINTGDVESGRFTHNDLSDWEGLPGQAKKAIVEGDILYSEIRPGNGRYAFVNQQYPNAVVSTKFMVIEAGESILPKYLYHVVTSPELQNAMKLIAESRSGTFPQITFDSIAHLELMVPSKPEQLAVSSLLDAIEGRIRNNQKMNQTLEEIAKAIFKSWFVDFDPVRAKAEGRPTGLPPEISDLFPDELVDSEIGEIPKGWQELALNEVFTPRNERAGDREIREFSSTNEGIQPRDAKYKKNLSSSSSKNKVAYKGDFVFGMSREVQNFGLMSNDVGGFSSAYKIYEVFGDYDFSDFVYRQFLSRPQYYYQAVSASSREGQSISQDTLLNLKILSPTSSVLSIFNSTIAPLSERCELLLEENHLLSELRDTLLPKLISGELRIPDAEKFLEEAGI